MPTGRPGDQARPPRSLASMPPSAVLAAPGGSRPRSVASCEDVSVRPLRVALLSYRSKPHCGGQGVYVRHLSRELAALGHHVEVFSGQPYPDLDRAGGSGEPVLRALPSLDLYRDDDPFRTPGLREFRDGIDALELAVMWTGGFPEPLTFSLRAAR